MTKKGICNVRGAAYTKICLDPLQIDILVNELRSAADCCLKCGLSTHYIKDCGKLAPKNNK